MAVIFLEVFLQEDKRVERLIELSLKLEGLNRNVATHAAGVVIADKKLTNIVPLYKDASANLLLPSTDHKDSEFGILIFLSDVTNPLSIK